MRAGIAKALWKRPVKDERIDALISEIKSEAYADNDAEVETERLGEMVMERLRELDQVAFVRFASVYRRFENVRDFIAELRQLRNDDDHT